MKLTKAQKTRIETARHHARRAHRFLMSDSVEVVKDFGGDKVAITKTHGSDLVGLEFCIEMLEDLICNREATR